MRRARLVAVFLVAASFPAKGDEIPVKHWDSPPYWTPRISVDAPGRPEIRDGARSGRQPLAVGPAALPFIPLPPCRLVDTRGNDAPLTGGFLPPASVRSYTLTGVCNVPANAQAISLNAEVVKPTGPGFLTLWMQGAPFPSVSTVNYLGNDIVVNAAVVPLSATGAISMALGVSGGDVILDTNGYYASMPSVTSLNALTGDVTLAAGPNVSVTPTGSNTLTIAAAAGGPPSGAAGGGLSGSYPNPGIAASAVGSTQLANGAAVRSINGAAQDMVTLQGSGDVTVTTTGSTITIGAPSGSMLLGAPGDTTLIGSGYTEITPTSICCVWTATTTTGAPLGRYSHTAIWTGSRMIVWGGGGDINYLNDGGQYDPTTNAWTSTSTLGAPSARLGHTAIWTGSRMIVWGGWGGTVSLNDGGKYDPASNSWTAITKSGAPSGRALHSAVWTGSKMIIWGGNDTPALVFNDGGQYDPLTDSWLALSTTSAPSARAVHTAVWTGSRMVVWGGVIGIGTFLGDGGQYDPIANSWTATAMTGAPSARASHQAVWTGARMIVWGGENSTLTYMNDGGRYDPIANTWAPTTTTAAPQARRFHTSVWTGSRMVIWGGAGFNSYINDGGQYDPIADTWTATTTADAPSGRELFSAVWTGSRMIVWGGSHQGPLLNTGGEWTPVSLYRKN
jgi:N-acetylneuraminic acid mutarotase